MRLGFGVVDMRELPGVEDALPSAKSIPYFYSVLVALEKQRSPLFAEVKRWIFICTDKDQRLHAMNFVESHGAFNSLHVDFSDYCPGKFERLGDAVVGRATKIFILTFLQDTDARAHIQIPTDFYPPETLVYNKPHSYNELEYRVYNTELRMEFYLWVVRKFCRPRGSILSIFGGGKITCAAMVSSKSTRVKLISCSPSY